MEDLLSLNVYLYTLKHHNEKKHYKYSWVAVGKNKQTPAIYCWCASNILLVCVCSSLQLPRDTTPCCDEVADVTYILSLS